MVFRPIAFISRSSERGAFGAEAAGMQDAMWSFADLIYRNQGPESDQDWLTDELMEEAVTALGLDVEKWRADYTGSAAEQNLLENTSLAEQDEVTATPTFVVRGPGGERLALRRRRVVRAGGRRGRGGSPDVSGRRP